MLVDIFLVVGALTPLAAYEQWREFVQSKASSRDQSPV